MFFNPDFLIVDSYAQREEARKALSQDENWMNNYVKKILKMLVKQVIYYCCINMINGLPENSSALKPQRGGLTHWGLI